MENVLVSIACLTYNQEKYIRKCLDSLIMQKTNFKFEILVHDDASTDHTPEIIKEYEKQYPDIIRPIYQTENQFSQDIRQLSWRNQFPRAKGKYIAFCEGDDYWRDEYKLQKQFDVMEANPDCSLCVHKVEVVDTNGNPTGGAYPRRDSFYSIVNNERISNIDFLKYMCNVDVYPIQTTAYFIRSSVVKTKLDNIPTFIEISDVEDVPLLLLASSEGNVYFINEFLSCYRAGRPGSWDDIIFSVNEKAIKHFQILTECLKEYNIYTNYKYEDQLVRLIHKKEFTTEKLLGNYRKLMSSEYRDIFDGLSWQGRFHIFLLAYFPNTTKFIDKLRNKK